DHSSRDRAAAQFHLDRDEIESRHSAPFAEYEAGRISLAEYLNRAIFWKARSFSREEFERFMFAQSTEKSETRPLLDELAASGRYLMATLNNEGRELNAYRISKFELGRVFSLFFSSCYLGLRKPDPAMYRLALDVTLRRPEESIFVDDREENIEGARRV